MHAIAQTNSWPRKALRRGSVQNGIVCYASLYFLANATTYRAQRHHFSELIYFRIFIPFSYLCLSLFAEISISTAKYYLEIFMQALTELTIPEARIAFPTGADALIDEAKCWASGNSTEGEFKSF